MTLKEQIQAELGEEFNILKIEINRADSNGLPGTSIKLLRQATAVPVKITNEWFFAVTNKMDADQMIKVIRSYLTNDKR